jgi:hypothetical protein
LYRWTVLHLHDSRRVVVVGDGEPVAVGDKDIAGLPDLLLIRERCVWIELKSATGRLRPSQKRILEALRAAGQEVYVWRPAHLEEAKTGSGALRRPRMNSPSLRLAGKIGCIERPGGARTPRARPTPEPSGRDRHGRCYLLRWQGMTKRQPPRFRSCEWCGASFQIKTTKHRFCSKACGQKAWLKDKPGYMVEAQRRYVAKSPDRRKSYMRAYRASNPAKARQQELRRTQKRRAHLKARTDQIKLERGCIDCGYREHAEALDFDHRDPSMKTQNVSWLLMRSWDKVLAEIAKCDVRCANCHRVRTAQRGYSNEKRPPGPSPEQGRLL